ncbi:MAG: efflux RND transporter periplasmic adaptor subunit [Burkholderiaceae bacterium]|nr:efflux RND transporter periplasmic adaptor subunit [Burkholderiaceae bacterium]
MPFHPAARTSAFALALSAAWVGLHAATPTAAPAALPALAWSDTQIKAAGITTQTLTASPARAGAGVVLQGTVELPPQATELLSAPLAGVVQQVLVSPGQKVKAGEPIARLLSPELVTWQRELLQAQAQARLSASKLERDEKLHAEGIIAGLRLQDSRTQNELAQLAVKERRQTLQLAGVNTASESLQPGLNLRAATTGTVLEVMATPGQRLEAGMPVAKVARSGKLSVALQATPAQAQNLRVGDLLALPGCQAPARLTAIVPQVSADNQAVQLRADFTASEDCLRVNQFVQATVQGRAPGGAAAPGSLGVPVSAVVRHAGQAYVFVRTPQGFVPTAIAVAGESGAQILVRSGLQGHEEIAVRGTAALKGAWQGLGAGEP